MVHRLVVLALAIGLFAHGGDATALTPAPATQRCEPAIAGEDPLPKDQEYIGEAWMREDGTIVLNLRAESATGIIGHSQKTYAATHPKYCDILTHLGGLQPGERKLVPPWSD